MPCYHPIAAYQKAPGATLNFARSAPHNIQVPCGKCLGCKHTHARAWGLRSEHECKRSEHNTFVNLTYDDAHLPESGHLRWRDVQLLLKRIRKAQTSLLSDPRQNIRYLACGEYGGKTGRPHYHLILYNLAFGDQFKVGKDLYDSLKLQQLWADKDGKPLGATRIAPATFGRAVYIAKYTFKDGGLSRGWKRYRNAEGKYDGEINAYGEWRPSPRAHMSLRPAIAKDWIAKYWQDLEHGYLVHDGKQVPIPRYYRKWIDDNRPYFRALVAQSIQKHATQDRDDNTDERRTAAEIIHARRNELLTARRGL